MDQQLGRRLFLQVAGAAGVAAGCSPAHAPEKLIPLLVPAKEIVPGRPTDYRTVCRTCEAGCGVTARTREGRVVKLEGNPDDPTSGGALCARGQAAVQELYLPDRLRGPMQRQPDGTFAAISWDAALALVAEALGKARAEGERPGRVRLLTRPEPGSAGEVQRAFLAGLGAKPEHRAVFSPHDRPALRGAAEQLFGLAELPRYDLAQALAVVSFGADFTETWGSPVELSRGFAQSRARGGVHRTHFTWVGPRLSMTGAQSDDWLAVRPGGERDAALLLLRALVSQPAGLAGPQAAIAQVAAAFASFDAKAALERAGLAQRQVDQLAALLRARSPSALLGPGPQAAGADGEACAAALLLCNLVLGNLGHTVLFGQDAAADPASPQAVLRLLAEADRGEVDVLLLHRADPVGRLPAALGAAAALGKVKLLVSFADRLDQSTQKAHLVLPDHHALESFDTLVPRVGVVALQQPVIAPLGQTRAHAQTLIDLAQKLSVAGLPADAKAHARARAQAGAAAGTEAHALFAKGISVQGAPVKEVLLRAEGLTLLSAPRPAAPAAGELSLVPFPTALPVADPDAAPWLREVPDSLSGLSWTSWAELSVATAARLGVKDAERVSVASPQGEVHLVLRVNPGLHDEALALPTSARELLALLPAPRAQAREGQAVSVRVQKSGPAQALVAALAPMSRGQEGRDLARAVSQSHPALPPEPPVRQMVKEHPHQDHRWAMAIDLDKCTGCQACVVACYAENNIPVNGPEMAAAGRNMAWLRLQRTFEARPATGRVKLRLLPTLCQQCDAAPCEPVCPVYATYHTPEGLNAQVYNRCIGTRYCANNCPYDARVFNWKDPEFEGPLQLQLNPDVSVRGRGIMEKCTFCVQRVRSSEHQAKREGRLMRDGDVVPACAQTCPAEAIVFGDRNDPESRVSRLAEDPRAYALMGELNTRPAIAYLARIEQDQ